MNNKNKFKILIIDTYYSGFLRNFYLNNPTTINKSYQEQKKTLLNQCFGTSDYYSYNLQQLGYRADDLIVNDEILQRQWVKEHHLDVSGSNWFSKVQMLPYIHRFLGRPKWVQEITLAQIKVIKPDVVYMQDLSILNSGTLQEIKKICKLLVGQIAYPLPAEENLKQFDLILTSFPHYVERFRKMGINSEYFKIGFEVRVLDKVGEHDRIYDVGFIGSFSPHHSAGTKLLEEVASKIPLHVWGQGINFLSPTSPLRKNYHGEAWGLQMYKMLARTKIVINRHIDVAENHANNMRLYESTGMGAMLITDKKDNLSDLFKVGQEIISYETALDLTKKIEYYLKHEEKRQEIVKMGQKRTLEDHNYKKRMKELVKILERYL